MSDMERITMLLHTCPDCGHVKQPDEEACASCMLDGMREENAELREALDAHAANGDRARHHLALIYAALTGGPVPADNVDLSQLAPDVAEHMEELRRLRGVEDRLIALRSASRALLDAVTDTCHVPDAESDASPAWRRLGGAHRDLERILTKEDL